MMEEKKFNIIEHCKVRPLSWSAVSSFEYSPEQWFTKYIKGEQEPENIQMAFGKVIGQRLASDPLFLPEIPRYAQFEKMLEANISDLKILGFLDSYCPDTKAFHEYKTSSNKERWNKKTANEHGQMMFYMLLIWINYAIKPEEVNASLHYIPVHEINGEMKLATLLPCQSFEVKHTSLEVLKFANYLKETAKAMETYAQSRLA